jgi:amino acid adenylation domain-containing protein
VTRVCDALAEEGLWQQGVRIALLAQKGLPAYAAMLAIMRSGNTYTPLNEAMPVERLRSCLGLATPALLIADAENSHLASRLCEETRLTTLLVDVESLAAESGEPLLWRCFGTAAPTLDRYLTSDAAPAYLLFTSGSTGTPKGVAISHASATACINSVHGLFPSDAEDRFTQFADLTFDFSIGEMFLCWRAGACLYVPSPREKLVPSEFVRRHGLTVWSSVPTLASNMQLLGLLRPGWLPSLRLSFFCGETLPTALAREWQSAAPNSRIVNLYGPTETAVFATSYEYRTSRAALPAVPIGRPFEGFCYRVVDDEGREAPEGSSGELWLAGEQVASGYWRDEPATRRAFVHVGTSASVWYRTGDIVSLSREHGLVFHGRADRQIKMRGYRVELQEIEWAVRQATGAHAVHVVPTQVTNGSCDRVVAYCIGGEPIVDADARARCRQWLPEYMIPMRVIQVDHLPTNSSGKVDYRALAERAHVDSRVDP